MTWILTPSRTASARPFLAVSRQRLMGEENIWVTCWAWAAKLLPSSSHWNSAAPERPGSLEEPFADFQPVNYKFKRRINGIEKIL
jgi:hypothetical protein